MPSQAVLDWAKSRSRTEEDDDGHRRRHVVMTLRKKKGPSAAALLSPSRQSARKGPVEQEMEPSRKSQRKSKWPMHFSINDDNEDETQEPKQNGYHATVSQDERTLQRLIHQYPNWQVISSKVLPLYNSTKKTMSTSALTSPFWLTGRWAISNQSLFLNRKLRVVRASQLARQLHSSCRISKINLRWTILIKLR